MRNEVKIREKERVQLLNWTNIGCLTSFFRLFVVQPGYLMR